MIIISHRGNLSGPNPPTENHPVLVTDVIARGFHCEIDVWFNDGQFSLGHDEPVYKIDPIFLVNDKLWCHAKNLEALTEMMKNPFIHCFWHQSDDYTITSRRFIWTYPGKTLSSRSIAVITGDAWLVPHRGYIPKCAGICTDYPIHY